MHERPSVQSNCKQIIECRWKLKSLSYYSSIRLRELDGLLGILDSFVSLAIRQRMREDRAVSFVDVDAIKAATQTLGPGKTFFSGDGDGRLHDRG
jgi:hypothetical protein